MYASFQRQLHLYGFKKVTKGIDIDSFYHELFLRGRPDLSQLMIRNKSKSQGSSDDTKCDIFSSPILNAKIPESNFYSICTNNSSYEVKSRQAISAVPGTLWEGSETWLEESPTLAESSACVKKSHQIETISHLSELHDTTIQVPRSGNDEESTECCTSYDALFPNER